MQDIYEFSPIRVPDNSVSIAPMQAFARQPPLSIASADLLETLHVHYAHLIEISNAAALLTFILFEFYD